MGEFCGASSQRTRRSGVFWLLRSAAVPRKSSLSWTVAPLARLTIPQKDVPVLPGSSGTLSAPDLEDRR